MPFPVQNIRDAAKSRGLTLAQIERALSIGNGVIAKWEKNKGAPPYDRIVAIAEYLDVPVSRLTGEDGQKEKSAPESGNGPNKEKFIAWIESASREELIEALQVVTKKLSEL